MSDADGMTLQFAKAICEGAPDMSDADMATIIVGILTALRAPTAPMLMAGAEALADIGGEGVSVAPMQALMMAWREMIKVLYAEVPRDDPPHLASDVEP